MDQSKNPFEEERLQILQMVEEGKLSAVEAVGLLNALAKDARPAQQAEPPVNSNQRFFRVRVTDTHSGRHKVMVTLPLSLMDWGLRIGARFSPDVPEINFQELSDIMRSTTDGKLVDVLDEEDGEHVEIFID